MAIWLSRLFVTKYIGLVNYVPIGEGGEGDATYGKFFFI
jgi:hypothetical protein